MVMSFLAGIIAVILLKVNLIDFNKGKMACKNRVS